jgi:hypothetical protein
MGVDLVAETGMTPALDDVPAGPGEAAPVDKRAREPVGASFFSR